MKRPKTSTSSSSAAAGMIVKWSFPLPDLGDMAVKALYSSFRKHSVEIHSLKEGDLADSRKFLDLNKWTLTLHDLSGQDMATLHI